MSFNNSLLMKLDDVCIKITDGSHYSPKDDSQGIYPMLSVKDMTEYGFDYSSCKRICEDDFKIMLQSDCVPKLNDVLVAKDGSYLKHVFITKEERKEAILSSIAIFRPDVNKIYPRYLCYILKNPAMKAIIKDNYVSGSALPRIVLKDFKKVLIDIPSVAEQKAISNTLSCLDDKIENNIRINNVLLEMAQAVFKSWFVDFEPFQEAGFQNSELGLIPHGWCVKSLYDYAEYINGTSFKKEEYSNCGYPIIKITELKNGITGATQYFNGKKDPKYFIDTEDILFSWSGNPQTSIDIFIWVGGKAILNQHTFKISIKNNDYSFIYLLLKSFKPEFTRIASGKQTTGLGHVTVSDLKRLKFPCNTEVIKKFCINLDPVIKMYVNNLIENEKLRKTRDSLLPKLMSGEIRIPLEEVQ